MNPHALADRLRARFAAAFGARPRRRVAVAPGRVNLVGEHTDYNDGFVLPIAIDRYVGVAFAARTDGVIRVRAEDVGETAELRLDDLRPGAHSGWTAYAAGIAWSMREARLPVTGADMLVAGDVPVGAGLASSAALELALARALAAAAEVDWDPPAMAVLARRAENEYTGVPCGIMDQFTAAAARPGAALLLDCRSLEAEAVPLPPGAAVAVLDTGLRRTLADGAFRERRARCHEAAAAIAHGEPGVSALRDVAPELLERFRDRLDPVAYRRARHVVEENARPAAMARALRAGDLEGAGRLMNESHRSLRDLFEVSGPELDAMVDAAAAHPACFGARLTGAGFAGCAVALVERAGFVAFRDAVLAAYRARFERPAAVWPCEPAEGARLVE